MNFENGNGNGLAMREQASMATLGQVEAFYKDTVAQYNHVTLGEEDGKTVQALALALGENVALLGLPGGSKSDLSESAHRVVDGIEDDRMVTIPNQADLRPVTLIGGRVEHERTTNGHIETVVTDQPALIRPDTQKIFADELTRINPHAVGALLELVRKREVMTTAGRLALTGLEVMNVTLNPSESRQNTFTIADALASRIQHAAVMGVRNQNVTRGIMGGMEPDAGKIEPVATLQELHEIRRYLLSNKTAFSDKMQDRAVELVENMTDTLASEFNFHETDYRMAYQMRRNARAMAAFRGRESVSEQDLHDAARSIYTARLGLSGLRGSGLSVNDIYGATQEVLNK
jgi:MoxR-like ATPase